MRPVSGNGRRSFLRKHIYYQTYTTQTNFQICTLLSYLSLFLIFACYPAFLLPRRGGRGRKGKGVVCAVPVCGGSREGSCCLSVVFRTAACFCRTLHVLSGVLYLSYIVLPCPVPSLYFLILPVRCVSLPVFLYLSESAPDGFLTAGTAGTTGTVRVSVMWSLPPLFLV